MLKDHFKTVLLVFVLLLDTVLKDFTRRLVVLRLCAVWEHNIKSTSSQKNAIDLM